MRRAYELPRCGASGGAGLACDKPAGHPGQHRDSAVEAAGRLGTWIHAPTFDGTEPPTPATTPEPEPLTLRPSRLQMGMFD